MECGEIDEQLEKDEDIERRGEDKEADGFSRGEEDGRSGSGRSGRTTRRAKAARRMMARMKPKRIRVREDHDDDLGLIR